MKTLSIVPLCLALGCTSAIGIEGLAGKDGAPGPTGPPGAQGPAGTPAVQSGGRLKARWRGADDGAREFAGWWDSALSINCDFRLSSDGVERCLPLAREDPYLRVFVDAECTQPAYAIYKPFVPCDGLEYALQGLPSCPLQTMYDVYELGEQLPIAVTYYEPGLCKPAPTGAIVEVRAAAVVFATKFVPAATETEE